MPLSQLVFPLLAAVGGLLACWLLCSVFGGALLWLRLRTLGERDQLRIGRFNGRLVRVGPLRLELEQTGGGRVFLPNLVALFRPLVMQRENEAAPVSLLIELPQVATARPEEVREYLRVLYSAAVLSPYRDGRVAVETAHRGTCGEVQLSLTRLSCRDEMQHYLRSHLELAMARRSSD